MKKQLFLFAFILSAFTSTQFVTAQNTSVISTSATIQQDEMSAEKQAKKIVNLYGRGDALTKSQVNDIYSLYTKLEEKIKVVNGIKDVEQRQQKTNKLQIYISKKLQNILTDAQHEVYVKNILEN